jgi:hypothetical protein
MDKVVANMLNVNIISKVRKGPYRSNIFFVPKDKGKLRPVVDYAHLTKHLPVPKLVMPNIFQIVEKKKWPPGLFYCKLDLKNAFYNIPLHPKSRHVTAFEYKGNQYAFNKLPFGISIAPYAMQKHLNAILAHIRKFTEHCWGHIDDVLVGHHNKHKLQVFVADLIRKILAALWPLNWEKSNLVPKQEVTFLGSTWDAQGVTRSKAATAKVRQIWRAIEHRDIGGKILERVRGFYNYYLNFKGRYHSLVNRILIAPNKHRYASIIHHLALHDYMTFHVKRPPDQKVEIASDASLYGLGAITMDQTPPTAMWRRSVNNSILINELLAALLAMRMAYNGFRSKRVLLRVDNKAVVAMINRGTCNWKISISLLFNFLNKINFYKQRLFLRTSYIKSEINPADIISRM